MFAYAYPPKCLIPRVIQYIEAIPLSDFTDCAPMAQETLVSGTTTAIDSSSNLVTNISGITLSTQNSDLPFEPTSSVQR